MKKIKKSILIILCACICAGCFSSCDEQSKNDGSETQRTESGNSENTNEKATEAEEEEVAVADFGDVGNNPNNIYQTEYTPAFDETHIYSYGETSAGWRIISSDLNGTVENEWECEGSPRFLNAYNGYLYYSHASRNQVQIWRVDTDTGENTVLYDAQYNYFDSYDKIEVQSVFIAEGYLFFSYIMNRLSSEDSSVVEIIELKSGDCCRSVLYLSRNTPIKFTYSDGTLYAFDNHSNIYMISIADVKKWFELTDIGEKQTTTLNFEETSDAVELGENNTVVFTPQSIYSFFSKNNYVHYYSYKKADFGEIDSKNRCLGDRNSLGSSMPPFGTPDWQTIYGEKHRFVLGDNMLILDTLSYFDQNNQKMFIDYVVWCFPHFDFENGFVIKENLTPYSSGSSTSWGKNCMGVFNDTLYILQEDGTWSKITLEDIRVAEKSAPERDFEKETESGNFSLVLHYEIKEDKTMYISLVDKDVDRVLLNKYSTYPWQQQAGKVNKVIFDDEIESNAGALGMLDSWFFECTNLAYVKLPKGLTVIGNRTFSGCANLKKVIIPPTVTEIKVNAFERCSKDLVISGESGSYAEEYAKKSGYAFEAQ